MISRADVVTALFELVVDFFVSLWPGRDDEDKKKDQ